MSSQATSAPALVKLAYVMTTRRATPPLLKDLNERDGKTIIMVTHDPSLAAQYAHRIVTMLDGAIVSDRPEPRA